MIEYLALFKTAKEILPENTMSVVIMYFLLKRDIRKAFEKAKPGMLTELSEVISKQVVIIKVSIDEQVGKLVTAIKEHNTRLGVLETDVGQIKKKLAVGPSENSKQTTTQGG